MTPSNGQLGRGMRRLREARRLSIQELAGEAGMHPTYLSTVERGLGNPTWEKVCGLAETFGITVCQLARIAEAEMYGAPYVPFSDPARRDD
jgi:transcriptional regulator with XRE-family HTH domain